MTMLREEIVIAPSLLVAKGNARISERGTCTASARDLGCVRKNSSSIPNV